MDSKRYLQKVPSEWNGKQAEPLSLVYPAQPEEDNEGGLDLGQFVAAVRRRIFVVAAVTTAVGSAALAVALSSDPIYEAKFELLVEPVTVENKLTVSPLLEQKESTSVDETELRVLQSPKLMNPIIEKIQTRYLGSGSPKLNIKRIDKTKILEVSYQDLDPEKVKFVLDIVAKSYLAYSLEERQIDVRQGVQFVENQLPQLQRRVEVLQEQLQKFRQRYDLIDPQGKGQQLSNQLNSIVQQRLEIQTQLAKIRSLYTTLQSQLKLQPNQVTDASALSEAPRYQNLLNQLQQIQTKIAQESVRYREDSPTIQNLLAQEENLLPLVEKERRRLLLNQLPSTIHKDRDLASPNSIRSSQIQQFLDAANQGQALEAQNKALAQAESFFRQQVRQFPVLARQNDDLERQLKIAVDNLNQFLTKREALRIDAAQKQMPWQLLTPPTDPKISSGSAKNILILGTALGLLLGVGAALLVDKLNNVLYTLEDVKDTTKLPLLGEIPFKERSKLAETAGVVGLIRKLGYVFQLNRRGKRSSYYNFSHFWESLSSLYTNIRFLSFDAPERSIAIISATSGDGKSTIALHLAQSVAKMGQRVLLVDADLRKPSIHTILGLPNTKGLSNAIAENLNFRDVIQQVRSDATKAQGYESGQIEELPLGDNFFVLTAGRVPPNPTNLLSSQKMRDLTVELHKAFDLVIYDTSPLLDFADSNILTTHTDASMLVVQLGKTNRSDLAKALESLKLSSTPVLGVVANGVTG